MKSLCVKVTLTVRIAIAAENENARFFLWLAFFFLVATLKIQKMQNEQNHILAFSRICFLSFEIGGRHSFLCNWTLKSERIESVLEWTLSALNAVLKLRFMYLNAFSTQTHTRVKT